MNTGVRPESGRIRPERSSGARPCALNSRGLASWAVRWLMRLTLLQRDPQLEASTRALERWSRCQKRAEVGTEKFIARMPASRWFKAVDLKFVLKRSERQ